MYATLHFQRGPLLALLAVFFLALMAALAPGLSEVDVRGIVGGGASGPDAGLLAAPSARGAPAWVSDPLEPPLADMARALPSR
jgi:hypothetical protein